MVNGDTPSLVRCSACFVEHRTDRGHDTGSDRGGKDPGAVRNESAHPTWLGFLVCAAFVEAGGMREMWHAHHKILGYVDEACFGMDVTPGGAKFSQDSQT